MTCETEVAIPVMEVLNESLLGELTTTEIRAEIRHRINLDADDLKPLLNRNDQLIDQTVRNIKCHRGSVGNPVHEGLLAVVPRGLRITQKGRDYLAQLRQ